MTHIRKCFARPNITNWIEAAAAVAIVIITFCYTRYAGQQVTAMNRQLTVIQGQLDANRQDLRPWVGVEHFSLLDEPAVGKIVVIRMPLVIAGKTPALNVQTSVSVIVDHYNAPWSPRPDLNALTLLPGTGTAKFSATSEHPVTAVEGLAYRQPGTDYGVFVRVNITYDDTFGCSHFSAICMSHKFGEPLDWFGYCGDGKGNNVDVEPKCRK